MMLLLSNKLKKTGHFSVKTIVLSFSLSMVEIQYLKHIMFVKLTKQAKEALSTKSLTVKNTGIYYNTKAIADGKKHIIQDLCMVKTFRWR